MGTGDGVTELPDTIGNYTNYCEVTVVLPLELALKSLVKLMEILVLQVTNW